MAYTGQTIENPVSGEKITFIPAGAGRPRDARPARLDGDAQGPRRALRAGHARARARAVAVRAGP
jgi:hypothetical protein